MSVYLISYDLIREKDYSRLHDKIRSLSGTWCKPLESTWLIVTNKLSSSEICDQLLTAVDDDDKLLVCKIEAGDSAWRLFNEKADDWMLKKLS